MGGDLDTLSLGDAKGCKDCVGGMAGRVGDLGDVCTIPLGDVEDCKACLSMMDGKGGGVGDLGGVSLDLGTISLGDVEDCKVRLGGMGGGLCGKGGVTGDLDAGTALGKVNGNGMLCLGGMGGGLNGGNGFLFNNLRFEAPFWLTADTHFSAIMGCGYL